MFPRFENSRKVEMSNSRESLMVLSDGFCRLSNPQRFDVACLLLTQYSLLLPIR